MMEKYCFEKMGIHRSIDSKTWLDTHYSFLNLKIQAYVEDENNILIEGNIVEAISFNGGLSVTTAVLVDATNIFGKISLNKKRFKIRTGARKTHELFWRKDLVEVTKSSNVSVPENISLTKLQKYADNDLFENFV